MTKDKKIDLYTFIHKAQRVHLFDLCAKIGWTDFSDAQAATAIEQEVRLIIEHLRQHGVNEDTFIHPLLREAGDHASAIDDEHDDLDQELNKLELILDEKNWDVLYSEFARFIGIYLLHQDEEEKLQVDVLWKHFDNDRLGAVLVAFKSSRSPEQNSEDIKFLIPGLSISELTHMYLSIKDANIHAFQAACKIAESQLEPSRWKALRLAVGF